MSSVQTYPLSGTSARLGAIVNALRSDAAVVNGTEWEIVAVRA